MRSLRTAVRRWCILTLAVVALVGGAAGGMAVPGEVILNLANKADPSEDGVPTYEITAVVFMRGAAPISVRSFYPFLLLPPGTSREFGPFVVEEEPDALILLGRQRYPGLDWDSLAITVSSLVSGIPYEAGALRVVARLAPDGEPESTVLTGYLLAVRQFWRSRSEGPLYLLQTGEFNSGLEGFYVLVGEPRWPWLDDPLLQPLVGKDVRVRGRLIPAGEDVPLSEDRSVTYPLPAIVVDEIGEIELYERCGF
ncbi:MAG: hypothetical protein Kow0097_03970 [Candidatus Bipolaricaulota bacterium]|nr:hypothetical protein [Candidatus Bipolaricaulota bacterium]